MILSEQPKIEVLNVDCMEFMKDVPDKYFELAICDPPYGIGANKMTLGNGKEKIYRGENDWTAGYTIFEEDIINLIH